jgi:hypothetical protein
LVSARTGVSTNWCQHELVSARIDVSTIWCQHDLVSARIGVSTNWCQHELVSARTRVSTIWCQRHSVSARIGVSTIWCQHHLVSAPLGVSTNWCQHDLVSARLGDSTPRWQQGLAPPPLVILRRGSAPESSLDKFLLRGDQLSRGTTGSPQTRCARMRPGDCRDARIVRSGGVLVLHRTEGGTDRPPATDWAVARGPSLCSLLSGISVKAALPAPAYPVRGGGNRTASGILAPLYSPCASSAFGWSKSPSRSALAPVESPPGLVLSPVAVLSKPAVCLSSSLRQTRDRDE